MKTTSKTIFGLLTLGFVLSTTGAQSWAQSGTAEKPMKPQILKILCERSPLNSRCPKGSASAIPDSDKTPVPVGPSGGGALPPTTPSGVTPSTPVPDGTAKPTGGSTMTPAAPGTAPTSEKPTGSAADLSLPAIGSPAPANPTDSSPAAPTGGAVAPATTETPAAPAVPDKASPEAPTSSGTVVEVISADAKLKTLAAAIKAAGLEEALAGEGPFTIFAPSDEAFAVLPAAAVEDLMKPANKAKLAQLLKYHAVSGKMDAASLKSGEVTSLQGKPIAVKVEGDKVMVNSATVIQSDIPASNGVIHIIDKVILPFR